MGSELFQFDPGSVPFPSLCPSPLPSTHTNQHATKDENGCVPILKRGNDTSVAAVYILDICRYFSCRERECPTAWVSLGPSLLAGEWMSGANGFSWVPKGQDSYLLKRKLLARVSTSDEFGLQMQRVRVCVRESVCVYFSREVNMYLCVSFNSSYVCVCVFLVVEMYMCLFSSRVVWVRVRVFLVAELCACVCVCASLVAKVCVFIGETLLVRLFSSRYVWICLFSSKVVYGCVCQSF